MEAQFNVQVVGDRTPLPGPSDYVPERKFTDKQGFTISPRYTFRQSRPDPALVALRTTIGNCTKITIGPRYPEPRREYPTGPNYVPPPFGNVTPIRFPKSRKPREKIPMTPSPQDYRPIYDTNIGIKRNTKASIGNAKRPPIFVGDPTTPSGANYNPRFAVTQPSSPRHSIGRKYKEPKKDRTGEYVAARSTLSPKGHNFGRGSGRTEIIHL